MKFGEKIKNARVAKVMTQAELAQTVGVSLRTMVSYENGDSYPKKREVYGKLAEVLGVDTNYLLTENEEFISKATEKYGSRGKKYAQQLVTEVSGLFAGGDMDDDDLDAVMRAITDAYWIAKEKNKKYTPKKYRKADKE
ncbi:MAG TPA: helix-turn-helix transcriptional regulator [Paludibacter sp.]|nr:helix-turn-helix transcriptional regulator [Paludibacter sp.]